MQLLLQAPSTAHDSDSEADDAETPEQVLMRRTREFNVALRESPHRLQLWLDYAEFQEEVVRWVMAAARASRPVQRRFPAANRAWASTQKPCLDLHGHVCHDTG